MKIYSYPPAAPATAPVGGATEVKQDAQIAQGVTIISNTGASGPLAKEVKQDTQITLATAGNVSTASIDTKTPALVSGRVPVDGSGVTQPVSAATLPLPTGAATEATLAAMSAKLPALGQQVMAASQPVVIASNQTAIPVTTSVTDLTASGTITTINGNVATAAMNGIGTAAIQVVGTYTAVGGLTVQGTVDGTNYVAIGSIVNANTGAVTTTIATAVQGLFQVGTAGFQSIRVIALGAVTGTATVSIRGTRVTEVVDLGNSIPAGTNIIGALVANQSMSLAQLNGIALAVSQGVVNTGTQRVTLATDVPLPSSLAPTGLTLKQARVSLPTAGTAVRATTDAAAVSVTRRMFRLYIDPDDVTLDAKYYVGPSTVTFNGASTKGEQIFPGAPFCRDNDISDFYIVSSQSSQFFTVTEEE